MNRYSLLLPSLLCTSLALAQCPSSGTISANCTSTNLTVNGGTLTVAAGVTVTVTGTLTLRGNATLNATGATLNVGALTEGNGNGTGNTINGGTYTVAGDLTIGSGGDFAWNGGTATVSGATDISGADIVLDNLTLTTTALTMNVATIAMNGVDITTTGDMDFEEATISHSTFNIGGTLRINSGTTTASASTIHAGTGYAAGSSALGVDMNGGGILNLTNSTAMTIVDSLVNNELHIDNSEVTLSGSFNNVGNETLIVSNSGTISIGGNYDNHGSGNTTAADGGVIQVAGNFDNTGGGSVDVTSGALMVDGTFTGTAPVGGANCDGGGCCGGGCAALPITLWEFTLLEREGTVQVYWSTLSELNNEYFTIFRSRDGTQYEEVARVGSRGDAQTLQTYMYEDSPKDQGLWYYQLSQTDYDGTTEYVATGTVYVQEVAPALRISPTVVTAEASLVLQTKEDLTTQEVHLELMDITGRTFALTAREQSPHELSVDLAPLHLNQGMYWVHGNIGVAAVASQFRVQ